MLPHGAALSPLVALPLSDKHGQNCVGVPVSQVYDTSAPHPGAWHLECCAEPGGARQPEVLRKSKRWNPVWKKTYGEGQFCTALFCVL